jgi:hypothetical protein
MLLLSFTRFKINIIFFLLTLEELLKQNKIVESEIVRFDCFSSTHAHTLKRDKITSFFPQYIRMTELLTVKIVHLYRLA